MSLFNKLTQGVSEASNKAKNTIETSKLKNQISKNQEEINQPYLGIGKEVFGLLRANQPLTTESVETYITKIEYLINHNKELEKEIKAIWNEKECECGKIIPLDAKFCPSCGYKFPHLNEQALIKEETAKTILLGEENVTLTETDMQIEAHICKNCDADLETDTKYCGVCGTQVQVN